VVSAAISDLQSQNRVLWRLLFVSYPLTVAEEYDVNVHNGSWTLWRDCPATLAEVARQGLASQ